MPADPRDDFGSFASYEHMFFYLTDPYAMIREEIERLLRQQVADTVLDSIRTHDEPLWLTLGRQVDDPGKVVVGHYGFCFRANLSVRTSSHEEDLDSTLTFLFCDVDRRGEERSRILLDLHDDARAAFEPEEFQRRFLEFRHEEP